MGIDLDRRGRSVSRRGRALASPNLYLRLAAKLYKFLARRTTSKFNKIVLRRLHNSRVNRGPISLSKLARYAAQTNKSQPGKEHVFAVVATVTNDLRTTDLSAITVCALRFTEKARERIVAAGGKCLTFDQLALMRPKGENVVLLRGSRFRESLLHFGRAPGLPGSTTKPFVRSKGRKFERARGRRASRGYKA
jgi:large subunit ribosomal protein L18e